MSLRELAPGTGLDGQGTPAIDIVAVHGLNPFNKDRHAFNTWQKPQKETGHLWLRDAFPKVQPNARVYLYEYNSSPVFGAGKDTFIREANQLLDEVYGARWEKGQNIPIIFIGHSLGGLLIKQALVNAWANEKYRRIQTSTYGIIFFGTPQTGPGNNPEARLGMACVKIARSLPGIQSPNLIETLERGSLFSDFLREAFRHQLEAYKVVSCYEGIGDIVPFESAVMNLPGNRETQLRINADHRNMCRFDPSVSVDLDNYKKVERNLQILCADALVGSSREDDEQETSQVRQGGIDLGSRLLENVHSSQGNVSIPMAINIGEVPDLAYTVYRSCIQSSSSPEFARVSANVSYLHSALRMTREMLEGDTFSKDHSVQVRSISCSCFEALQDLQNAIDKFKAMPKYSQTSWNRIGFEFSNFAEIEKRLQSTISMVTDLNQTLSSGSMNHLVEKLNNLVEEVESGEAAVSIVSSYVSDVSQSINLHDEENWTLLRRELENCGLSSSILAEQREFISKWIINANEARRRQPDSHVPEVEATGNESVVALSDLIEQTVLAPEAKVPNMARRRKPDSHVPEAEATSNESVVAFSDSVEQTILAPEPKASDTAKTGRVNPSLMRRVRYGIFRRKNDLHRAVDKGDLAMVRELLTFKIPINAKNKYGRSAVRIAALKGDVEMMKLLLDQDASAFEDNQKPYCINEAMEISIRSCNWEAVEALLARGSSYRFGLFEIANAIGNVSTQTLRKMKESRSSGPTDEAIDKLVVPAATTGNIKALQLLLEEGADINAKSNNYAIADLSALHFAAANCNTTVMKLLLDNGADFEARDASGETPIHKIPCARDGIGMNYIDRNGTRIPYRISSCEPNKALHPWLRYTLYMRSNKTFQFSEIYDEDSTSLCDPNIALQLLLDSGADLNTKNYDGQTVVHLSAKYNEDSVLAALIEKGMNIEVIDNKGNTALHLAISAEYIRMQAYEERQWDAETKTPVTRWNKKVVLRLLKSKANANARNFDGKTPLHLACKYEHGKAAELLLEHGADVNIVDHRNWTALHHAVHNGSMSTVLVLLRYGASTSIRCLQDYGSKKTALEMAKLKGLDAIAQVLESVSTEN